MARFELVADETWGAREVERWLRGFCAVYFGLLVNCIVMGWVTLAMSKILHVMMGWDKVFSVAVLVVLTLSYTVLSGYWGVVVTDFFQFILAMLGAIVLMLSFWCRWADRAPWWRKCWLRPGWTRRCSTSCPTLERPRTWLS